MISMHSSFSKSIRIPVFLLLATTAGLAALVFNKQTATARLEPAAAAETSGIAVSNRSADRLWLLNDSGCAAELLLITAGGADRGRLRITGVANRDWEDLTAFRLNGKPYLLISDTGDNEGRYPTCKLHAVPEPPLPSGEARLDAATAPEWTIEFRYSDGPRDCESVAVDTAENRILLLSKRTDPPVIYQVPLRPAKGSEVVAKPIGTTSVKPPRGFPIHPYGSQPTGLAISPDGSMAAVATYLSVFVFPRAKGESWPEAFAKPATVLAPHTLPQAEAITFSTDGRSIIVASEGARTPLVFYQIQPGK